MGVAGYSVEGLVDLLAWFMVDMVGFVLFGCYFMV